MFIRNRIPVVQRTVGQKELKSSEQFILRLPGVPLPRWLDLIHKPSVVFSALCLGAWVLPFNTFAQRSYVDGRPISLEVRDPQIVSQQPPPRATWENPYAELFDPHDMGAIGISAGMIAQEGYRWSYGEPNIQLDNYAYVNVTGDITVGMVGAMGRDPTFVLAEGVLMPSYDYDNAENGNNRTTLNMRNGIAQTSNHQGGSGNYYNDIVVNNHSNAVILVGNADLSSSSAYGIIAQTVAPQRYSSGDGYNAPNVKLSNWGVVSVKGQFGAGLIAQSLGGLGGIGRSDNRIFSAVAGSGGKGGRPGSVSINLNHPNSYTSVIGDFSIGILGQSIGANGGHGGSAQSKGLFVDVAIGGNGGDGGDGGAVTLSSTASKKLRTSGQHGHGIMLQSIGGSGGVGGSAKSKSVGIVFDSAFAIGGSGGKAGNGGTITTQGAAQADIRTIGHDSGAIILQSIGGGGGHGGTASAQAIAIGLGTFDPELAEVPTVEIGFALGASGGVGGGGGRINYQHSGSIVTEGNTSIGILAQSIGAGGGSGGDGTATGGALGVRETELKLTMGLGGNGASAGSGGAVDLVANGSIRTSGAASTAMLAQSVGGGGGQAGTGNGVDFSFSYPTPEKQAEQVDEVVKEAAAIDDTAKRKSLLDEFEIPRITEYLSKPGEIWASAWLCLKTGLTSGLDSPETQKSCGGDGTDSAADDSKESAPEAPKQKEKPKPTTVNLRVNLGAKGGDAGHGDSVTVRSSAVVSTAGAGAHGVQAQSIGGGGGNSNTPGADASGGMVNATLTIGADGGKGGSGGVVSVSVNGPITTGLQFDLNDPTQTDPSLFTAPTVTGGEAHGIFAQSIGGGGGAAGTSDPHSSAPTGVIVDLFNLKDTAKKKLDEVEKKAKEKLAQVGEQALADFLGISVQELQTLKQDYDKVASLPDTVKQKIEEAKVRLEDSVLKDLGLTQEQVDHWRKAAGTAKFVLNGISLDKFKSLSGGSITFNPSITVGGKGATGGNGGTVNVNSMAAITTYGHRSYAILSQSVGGGGGTASTVHGALIDLSGEQNVSKGSLGFTPKINLGGQGGSGGNGGSVTLNVSGDIMTAGYASVGIMAQSIGGGGGIGHDGSTFGLSDTFEGDKGKITGAVNLGGSTTNEADYTISSDKSQLASGKVQFGNHATDQGKANSGSGGSVTLGLTGSRVQTHGDDAMAIMLQSVGGGGGVATLGCSNSGSQSSASACWGNVQTNGQGAPGEFTGAAGMNGVDITLNAGGSNRSGSADGGQVVGSLSAASITTYGNRSMAVVAQSVGGGGGFMVIPQSRLEKVTMAGSAGSSRGGSINLTVSDTQILTQGHGAWGVFAQSIGAGGGFFGDPSSDLVLNTAPIGEGTVNQSGPDRARVDVSLKKSRITTMGDNAHGIFVQRLSTAGGVWQDGTGLRSDSSAGTGQSSYGLNNSVNVLLDSTTVSVNGKSSRGVVIDVDRGAQAPTVFVRLDNGSGIFARDGTALQIVGGNSSDNVNYQNTIYIGQNSNVTQQSWLSQQAPPLDGSDAAINRWAIYTAGNRTSVESYGTIIGNVHLEGGELFNFGTFVGSKWVGSNNSFHNYGNIYVGGDGQPSTLEVVGSLKNYAGGEIHVTLDPTSLDGARDVITVTGLARIEGEIVPETQSLVPGDYQILRAGTLEFSGDVRDSLVFDWQIRADGGVITKTPTADFTPAGYGLTGNQAAMANYLQAGWDRADTNRAMLFGYVHEFDQASFVGYGNTLQELSGQVLNSQNIEMQTRFASGLTDSLSCPIVTEQGLRLNQTDCAWASVTGSIAEQSANSSNSGYHSTAGGIRLGAQKTLQQNWTAGFALGYANNYLTSTGFSSSGQFLNASLSAKKEVDNWEFGGSLGLAYGWFDNTRTPQLFANGAAQSMVNSYNSESKMMMLGVRLRGAYKFERGDQYLKPYVDVDLMYGNNPGFTETGDGLLALQANASSGYTFAISPMLEFGSDVAIDSQRRIRAYVNAGASFLPDNQVSRSMKFARVGTPGTFDIATSGPSVLGQLNIGIQAYEKGGLEVRAQYGLQAGEGYWNQSLSANLVWRF